MTKNVEARIALCIIRAQKSSDAGKGIDRISLSKKLSRPCMIGYGFKEADIVEAIRLIRRNKTQFNYWAEFAPDQNGVNSIVVYFDFKIDDERYQVSFHNHGARNLMHMSIQVVKPIGIKHLVHTIPVLSCRSIIRFHRQ